MSTLQRVLVIPRKNAETPIHCSVRVHEMIFFHFLKMKYENLHEVKHQLQLCPLVFENANYYLLFSLK